MCLFNVLLPLFLSSLRSLSRGARLVCAFDVSVASELANSVQDAFVIAVEEQAKVRLQRLLDLQRVKPVDMSQLSMQVLYITQKV